MKTSPVQAQKLTLFSNTIIKRIEDTEHSLKAGILASLNPGQELKKKTTLETLSMIRVQYHDRLTSISTLDDLAAVIVSLNAQEQAGNLDADGYKIILSFMRQAL